MLCASRRRSGCSSSPPPDPAAERSRASKAGARSDPNPASQPRLEPIQGRKTFHLAKSPAPAYVKTRVRQAASAAPPRGEPARFRRRAISLGALRAPALGAAVAVRAPAREADRATAAAAGEPSTTRLRASTSDADRQA